MKSLDAKFVTPNKQIILRGNLYTDANLVDSEYIDNYEDFDPSVSYAEGDIVRKEGKLYKFTTDHDGEWVEDDVEQTNVLEIAGEISGGQWGGITGDIENQTDLNNILTEKADKIPVESPASASTYELPWDVFTKLGTISQDVVLTLEEEPTDGNLHAYAFSLTIDAVTLPTITFPTITAWSGNCLESGLPKVSLGKTYEVNIQNGYGFINEF